MKIVTVYCSTLTDILGELVKRSELREVKDEIMEVGTVPTARETGKRYLCIIYAS